MDWQLAERDESRCGATNFFPEWGGMANSGESSILKHLPGIGVVKVFPGPKIWSLVELFKNFQAFHWL